MPLARFHMYAQGIDLWLAPTLATGRRAGSRRCSTSRARTGCSSSASTRSCTSTGSRPTSRTAIASCPRRYLAENGPWLEEGNTVIVGPAGRSSPVPCAEREETLIADLDLGSVAAARRLLDPVGHYNRPDVFRLHVDTSPRPAVVVETPSIQEPSASQRVDGGVRTG